jgi:large subunit ribosomal protein L18
MAKTNKKVLSRKRRQYKVRKKVVGIAERPRVTVFRSAKHIYAQLITDEGLAGSITIAGVSSKGLGISNGGNIEAAKKVGAKIAEIAKEKNIDKVVFDRNGFLYHGRVKALAEAIRETGLLK